jgi:hypothetical protein
MEDRGAPNTGVGRGEAVERQTQQQGQVAGRALGAVHGPVAHGGLEGAGDLRGDEGRLPDAYETERRTIAR